MERRVGLDSVPSGREGEPAAAGIFTSTLLAPLWYVSVHFTEIVTLDGTDPTRSTKIAGVATMFSMNWYMLLGNRPQMLSSG